VKIPFESHPALAPGCSLLLIPLPLSFFSSQTYSSFHSSSSGTPTSTSCSWLLYPSESLSRVNSLQISALIGFILAAMGSAEQLQHTTVTFSIIIKAFIHLCHRMTYQI
jgi:hypothetical protein